MRVTGRREKARDEALAVACPGLDPGNRKRIQGDALWCGSQNCQRPVRAPTVRRRRYCQIWYMTVKRRPLLIDRRLDTGSGSRPTRLEPLWRTGRGRLQAAARAAGRQPRVLVVNEPEG